MLELRNDLSKMLGILNRKLNLEVSCECVKNLPLLLLTEKVLRLPGAVIPSFCWNTLTVPGALNWPETTDAGQAQNYIIINIAIIIIVTIIIKNRTIRA